MMSSCAEVTVLDLEQDLPHHTAQRLHKLVELESVRSWLPRWPFQDKFGGATRLETLFRLDDWLTDLFGQDTTWKLLFKILDLRMEHHFEIILELLEMADELSLFCARLLVMPE